MLVPIVLAIMLAQAAPELPFTAPAGAKPPQASAAQTTPEQPWPPAGVNRPGAGTTSPRLIKEVKPHYPTAAKDAKIDGTILLEAVVESNGTVGEVRVTRSLDRQFGLDEEAVKTVRQWRFTPGRKDGVAVPVLVEVEMTFTLRR